MLASVTANPDWFMLSMGLFGGLALFLYGLDQLSDGLKHAAGDALKTLLTRLTINRFLGALTGALITGVCNEGRRIEAARRPRAHLMRGCEGLHRRREAG
jgi:hypothetical protein